MTTPKTHSILAIFIVTIWLISGCSTVQIHKQTKHKVIDLKTDQLKESGIAFLTPSATVDYEQDKQGLAFIFAEMLKEKRPEINSLSLSETLGIINQASLTQEYKTMFDFYNKTGIFPLKSLKKISQATQTKYFAHIQLASFERETQGRFGVFGFRLFQTKQANVRIFLQIWNSSNGFIVWEGSEELNLAFDTGSEQPIPFRNITRKVAENLFQLIP